MMPETVRQAPGAEGRKDNILIKKGDYKDDQIG